MSIRCNRHGHESCINQATCWEQQWSRFYEMSTVQRVQRSFAAHHLYVMLLQGCAAFALDRINDIDIKLNKIWTLATNHVKACQCHRSYLKASSYFSVHVA